MNCKAGLKTNGNCYKDNNITGFLQLPGTLLELL